jgi:RNA polymerase sigma factor (sigma-70 family)
MDDATGQVRDVPSNPAPPRVVEPAPSSLAGGAESIAALLPSLHPPLRRLFHRYHVRPHDVDDIVQTALLAVIQQRQHVRKPLAYFFGAVRRLAGQDLRRRAEERLVELADQHAVQLTSDSPAALIERRQDARTLVARLPLRARHIALLHYGADLSHRQIGAMLRMSEASVRQHLSRALRALRSEIHRPPDAPA